MNLVDDIPITEDGFGHISCIIEIPKGTNTKYEYNEKFNIFELERCLVSSLQYPINYGFISQTYALDNDPLDVLVEIDYKVIAVPHWSPKSRYPRLNAIEPEHLKIFKQFFRIYKIDRSSSVKVGEWKNGKTATSVVLNAHNRWAERQNNGNV